MDLEPCLFNLIHVVIQLSCQQMLSGRSLFRHILCPFLYFKIVALIKSSSSFEAFPVTAAIFLASASGCRDPKTDAKYCLYTLTSWPQTTSFYLLIFFFSVIGSKCKLFWFQVLHFDYQIV